MAAKSTDRRSTGASAPGARLAPSAWTAAARAALIAGGVAQVKIERLAADLGVTGGSFYWHFKDRGALLKALLDHWVDTNTDAMVDAVAGAGTSGDDQFKALIDVWVSEARFSSAFDAAVRDWARVSPEVAAAVSAVDRERIALLKSIFLNLGYDDDRAEVRARITYFHQVGYYALGLVDPPATRLRLRPLYLEALRGDPGR